MSKFSHTLLISFYFSVIISALIFITYNGFSYYQTPVVDRYFHPQYTLLEPSGIVGHGFGIFGTLLILFGIIIYVVRKRWKRVHNVGRLKYWLEFHIFLCTLGTVLVLFHTTFKFGGIISVGFWALALVWVSGFFGRYVYLQIPKAIDGRELTMIELNNNKTEIDNLLLNKYGIDFSLISTGRISKIRLKLLSKSISNADFHSVRKIIRKQRLLNRRILSLTKMHKLFNAWHYIHLPFSAIMILIMLIHVGVVLFFGYKWIF